MFFHFFLHVLRTSIDPDLPQGLISFKQVQKMSNFNMDNFRGFKVQYYFVVPFNRNAHKSHHEIPYRDFDVPNFSMEFSIPSSYSYFTTTM